MALVSSQFKLYIILINLVNVNYLSCCILISVISVQWYISLFPWRHNSKNKKTKSIHNIPSICLFFSLIAGANWWWKFWRITDCRTYVESGLCFNVTSWQPIVGSVGKWKVVGGSVKVWKVVRGSVIEAYNFVKCS